MASSLIFRCRRCAAMNRLALVVPDRAGRFGGNEVERVSGALPLEQLRRFAVAAPASVS